MTLKLIIAFCSGIIFCCLGLSQAYAQDSSVCTNPAFIKKITQAENNRLKKLGSKVSRVEFTGYSDDPPPYKFCSYVFTHKDGEQVNMSVELKKNGKFIIRGEE